LMSLGGKGGSSARHRKRGTIDFKFFREGRGKRGRRKRREEACLGRGVLLDHKGKGGTALPLRMKSEVQLRGRVYVVFQKERLRYFEVEIIDVRGRKKVLEVAEKKQDHFEGPPTSLKR